ncbi:MAG: phosphoribosylglycinamide synthetase C domain-containing protein, partial [Dethiobacteria bacterium]
YPGPYKSGKVIHGLVQGDPPAAGGTGAEEGLALCHAGTAVVRSGRIVTAGGRVLGVTAWAQELPEALQKAYRAVEQIKFEGCYYRRDIGHRALKR